MKKTMVFILTMIMVIISVSFAGADTMLYKINVNKQTNCVTVYRRDGNGEYQPFKAMVCSVGADNATPAGTYNTVEKYRWRPLFGDVYGQYATRIHGDILFHSVYYERTSPDTLQTEEYNKLGTPASMGCVRLTAADAKWIYDNCPVGTEVTIAENGNDPVAKPEFMRLGENAKYPNWDPTDPDENNPWKNEGVKFEYTSLHKKVKVSDEMTSEKLSRVMRYGVAAYDAANNPIDVMIAYNVEPTVPGKYNVKYFAVDLLGNYGEVNGFITIEE